MSDSKRQPPIGYRSLAGTVRAARRQRVSGRAQKWHRHTSAEDPNPAAHQLSTEGGMTPHMQIRLSTEGGMTPDIS
jgi:hypothetical protein